MGGVWGITFFIHFKTNRMTYIVREADQLKIIQVRADQEAYFQADYAGRIVASGNNTMEALIRFGELPNLTGLNDELNKAQSPQ